MESIEQLVTDLFTREPYMPRGAKRDIPGTEAKKYLDEGSFLALDGREFLAGNDWLLRKAECFDRDNFICQTCARRLEPGCEPVDPDHVLSRGKGGSDDLYNLKTLCRKCHNEKHSDRRVRWTKNEPKGGLSNGTDHSKEQQEGVHPGTGRTASSSLL